MLTGLGTNRERANRANAQRSTGPRSLPGKSMSRLNGRRHGLAAAAADDRWANGVAESALSDGLSAEDITEASAAAVQVLVARAKRLALVAMLGGEPNQLRLRLTEIERLDRYERRAFSRRHKGFQGSSWLER